MNKSHIKKPVPGKRLPMTILKSGFDKKNILYIYPTLLILLFNVLLIIIMLFVLTPKLPPQTPLYYGLPRGENQLANPLALILPVSLSSLFITLNSIVAYFVKSPFLKKVLIFGGFFTSLLASITVVNIILLNL